jgi:Protein of unknown function (DUF2975)
MPLRSPRWLDLLTQGEQAMTAKPKDKLLSVTSMLLKIVQGMLFFITAMIAIVVPIVWIKRSVVLAELASDGGLQNSGTSTLVALTALLLGGLAIVVLGIAFVRRMIAIIDTVATGTPFVPDNAVRLREMGWLVVATQGLAMLAWAAHAWFEAHLPKGNDVDFEVSLEAIVTALLLFVLAQVFEHGTRLADEAEGTV